MQSDSPDSHVHETDDLNCSWFIDQFGEFHVIDEHDEPPPEEEDHGDRGQGQDD